MRQLAKYFTPGAAENWTWEEASELPYQRQARGVPFLHWLLLVDFCFFKLVPYDNNEKKVRE